jgi:putative ABC transport system ATP-binding protein
VSEATVVHAEQLTKTYQAGDTEIPALVEASITLRPGEMVAVRGRSGSGKSTLLTILGLLSRPDSGTLRITDRDALALRQAAAADVRAKHVGFVFQSFNLLPHLTALENVTLAVRSSPRRARATAVELLESAGLGLRINHRPSQLSGGEQQRVALVRALINGPDLILADEPTGNLDAESEELVLGRLRAAADEGRAVLVASHSDNVCATADRILMMDKGKIID